MNPTLPNPQPPFFTTGLMVDTVSQHIEATINQSNTPEPKQRKLPSFPFNGVEYPAQKSNPTLIPTPRIG